MPVYYKIDNKEYQLAIKNNGWESSDPKAMVDWFNKHKDSAGQLVRSVMYLKGWCDNLRNKMPSGLAMTILAANGKNNIVHNDRDDIFLRDILNEIKKTLDSKFECIVPAVPYDDLFANYDENREKRFLDALNNFLTDANSALREPNELKASKLWRKHLGDRFPLGEDKNEEEKYYGGIITGVGSSNPYFKTDDTL